MNGHEKQSKGSAPSVPPEPSQRDADLKKLVKEIELLKKELADEKQRSADYVNRLKYLQAEMENLQKRTKREIEEIVARANERLISRLLVIIDDMEIAVKASLGIEKGEVIKSGFELILEKLRSALGEEGLAKVEAVGGKFDPMLHEAGDQIVKEDAPDGIVLEELKAGYTLKGKLLRPSVVVVAKNPKKSISEEVRGEAPFEQSENLGASDRR